MQISVALMWAFILLTLAASLARVVAGSSRHRWRQTFIGIVLLALCVIQYYHVYIAAIDSYPTGDESVFRYPCLSSSKGGKRASEDTRLPGVNPCFCHRNATCLVNWRLFDGDSCPIDGSAECYENYKSAGETQIVLHISERRDCTLGQGPKCTKDEPCTPCERSRLVEFGDTPPCTACSSGNSGDCRFVEGKGPYCWVDSSKFKVEPCRQCCTEPGELIFRNGACIG